MKEAIPQPKKRGTIKKFFAFRGSGSIVLDDEPNEEVFFDIKNIIGYDGKEYPFIAKGTPVEFLKEWEDIKGWRAYEVSQPGGEKLIFVPEDPGKNYNKAKLYTGTVFNFNWKSGFGWIDCDEKKIEYDGKTAKTRMILEVMEEGGEPQERMATLLYYRASEIAGVEDIKQGLIEGDKVEFYVYSCEMGLGAGRVKLLSRKTNKRKLEWVRQKYLKKCKIHRQMEEIEDYLNGNYRGALQEYFQQGVEKVAVTYETVQDPKFDNWFLATARTQGLVNDLVEGRGHAPNKTAANQYAALDLMFKLNLISEEKHRELHNIKSSTEKS